VISKGITLRRCRVVLLALSFAVGNPAAAEPNSPSGVVAGFQNQLLETMKQAKALGVRGRYTLLEPAIEGSFRLPLMIATASAPFWRSAPPGQREALLEAFRRMSIASAATLFDDYGGETFRIVRERDIGGPTVLVDTQIVRPARDPIDISYVTARLEGRWWIIDIIVGGGISELRVRSGEYLALLKDGGLPNLTRALSHKADRLLSGQEKAGPAGGR
jgi:phospholipid transport system substrate-binding protein